MSYLSVIDNFVGLTEIGDMHSIVERLKRKSSERITEFCISLFSELPLPETHEDKFRYVGNSAHSGLAHPCSGFDCRSKNLSISANFAAIYANHLVLFNPFLGLARLAAASQRNTLGTPLIQQVAFHVAEILLLRPLIDRKIVSFEREDDEKYCRSCTQKALGAILSGDAQNIKSDTLYFDLIEHFANNSLIEYIGKSGRQSKFLVRSKSDLSGHSETIFYRDTEKTPAQFSSGQLLKKEEVFQIGIAEKFAHFAGNDIVAASSICERYNIGNMIGGSSQLNVLQNYFGEEKFSKSLSINYPLISQSSIQDVLKFRDQEWHHLHDFREMIEDGTKSGADVNRQLADSSAKMQSIITKAKITSQRDIKKQIGVSVAAIAATAVTSGFSGLIAAVIGVLGTGHFAAGIVPKIIDRLSEPVELRDQKTYYAWKINNSKMLTTPPDHT